MLEGLKKARHKLLLDLYHLLPIQNNKIIMWNSMFKGYGCNPKYIAEYLNNNFRGKYDIVWVVDRELFEKADVPDGIRKVAYFSREYLKEISTAKVIISNVRTGKPHYFNKRKGQFYIQTWHSSLRLKKIEGDAIASLAPDHAEFALADSKKTDVIISGCGFSTNIFRNSFWYDGEIFNYGTPRCDILFSKDNKVKDKVYKALQIDKDEKIVLYAPTFRKGNNADFHNIDPEKITRVLSEKFGTRYRFVYRFHPNVKNIGNGFENGINATLYSDIQELVCAADALITDYSSCMFDMAIARKKCFLYTPDLEEYLAKERGLYFNIKELPFSYSHNNSELESNIKQYDNEKYLCKIDDFLKKTESYEDGEASKRVAKIIEGVCFGK